MVDRNRVLSPCSLAVAAGALVALCFIAMTDWHADRFQSDISRTVDFIGAAHHADRLIDEMEQLAGRYLLMGEPRDHERLLAVRERLANHIPRLEALSKGRVYSVGSLARLEARSADDIRGELDAATASHAAGTNRVQVLARIQPDLATTSLLRQRLYEGRDAAIGRLAVHDASRRSPSGALLALKGVLALVAALTLLLALLPLWRNLFTVWHRQSSGPGERAAPNHDPAPAVAVAIDAARADERARIGRDIHDELGALLMALKISLRRSARSAGLARRSVDRQLPVMLNHVDVAMGIVSDIAGQLRPCVVDRAGFQEATETYVRRFADISGIQCNLRIEPDSLEFVNDYEMGGEVFRVLQETLTNVARHAEATRIDIEIDVDGEHLRVQVADDGKGIPTERIVDSRSHGIASMRERARRIGGEMRFSGSLGFGTSVTLRVPLVVRA